MITKSNAGLGFNSSDGYMDIGLPGSKILLVGGALRHLELVPSIYTLPIYYLAQLNLKVSQSK